MADEDKTPSKTEPKTEPKRPRGRPKKAQADGADQPKRKPGRPRKTAETGADQPKRKPGRPRKTAETGADQITPETNAVEKETAVPLDDKSTAISDAELTLSDSDALDIGGLGGSATESDTSEEAITLTKEAIMARNSEERTMNEKEHPSAVGGDDFYDGSQDDKDWNEIGLHLIYMLVYGLAAYIMSIGFLVLAAVRFVLLIANPETAGKIGDFMTSVAALLGDIFAFLAGKSDKKPGLD